MNRPTDWPLVYIALGIDSTSALTLTQRIPHLWGKDALTMSSEKVEKSP